MSAESDTAAVFVDVTYRGLKVVHKARFRSEGKGGFVELETPLPVGAIVQIVETEGAAPKDARVVGVVEHEAGAKSPPGMRLAWESAAVQAPAVEAPVEAIDDTDMAQHSGPVDSGASASGDGKKGKRGGKKKNGR